TSPRSSTPTTTSRCSSTTAPSAVRRRHAATCAAPSWCSSSRRSGPTSRSSASSTCSTAASDAHTASPLLSEDMADLFLGGLIDAAHHRTDQRVLLPSGDLTTHGVIVGMTGSGKTGLGIVLVEEALSAGVPALLIDPKGDLTNLCLTFPDLSPADFRPWINDGDAQQAGVTPDAFAEQQATPRN